MSEFELNKLLNLLLDTELREENWCSKSLDDLEKLWDRDNNLLAERLIQIEKEATALNKTKSQLANLKDEILKTNSSEQECNCQIAELKSLLNETECEIRSVQSKEEKLKQQYEIRTSELGKLEKIENILKKHQSLYDQYLNTRLTYKAPNKFKLSFINEKNCNGWIMFEYNDDENSFTIAEIDPETMVSDLVINKFHKTQDTQGLLCYVREILLQN